MGGHGGAWEGTGGRGGWEGMGGEDAAAQNWVQCHSIFTKTIPWIEASLVFQLR